jgi:hypothetical protein
MSDLKEYIVTLIDSNNLDSFYEDMETPSCNLYIPNRIVECVNRRPISRNTHYMLTEQEAEQIKNDSRVLDCQQLAQNLGIEVRPCWTQTSTSWDKSFSTNNTMKNWALLRCTEGSTRANWGFDGANYSQSATVGSSLEGKNVDVVVVDGLANPNHPEFALNSDGTGGSRVVQYNWYQHRSGGGTHIYGNYTGTGAESNNNHGCHVAGTIAGNTQGWARSANIYNISPYGDDGNNHTAEEIFDFIRAFHLNKPINPNTGRKNPTIINNSWGYFFLPVPISQITSVNYRGINYNGPFTAETLQSLGLIVSSSSLPGVGYRYIALDTDIADAINDGIIIVGAAGNSSYKIDIPTGQDYNNRFVSNGNSYYYNRGATPTSSSTNICVGGIYNSVQERKRTDSNCGPRIDIYAPGTAIISSVNIAGVTDSRNSNFWLQKLGGTSMASPQVCGVLACTLELYPDMNQNDCINYLNSTSTKNQIYDTGGTDTLGLQQSVNRYLYLYKERPNIGSTWPKLNYKPRPTNGRMFPRVKVKR